MGRPKGSKLSEEHKLNISIANKGMKLTLQQRKKQSEALKGHIVTQKTRNKISKSKIGVSIHTPESKLKIIGTGRKHTKQTKEKIRLANVGRKHTLETKMKLRLARSRRRIPFKNTKPERFIQSILSVNGIKYETHKPIKIIDSWHQVDIFIEPNICIEVDGNYWHNLPENIKRDKIINIELKKQGYVVLRLWEHEIYENINKCLQKIKKYGRR